MLTQDPQSKFCPHSESPSTDTYNFADLLAGHAEDFQTPEGINHSLAALYKLLASDHISTRRATGLAYIASLLLRTLPDIRDQYDTVEGRNFSQSAPPRGCVGLSPDEYPQALSGFTPPKDDDPPSLASRPHASQQLSEIRGQAGRSLSYLRGLNIAKDYCGYCLTLVTRWPVKRTNTVLEGGWP